MTRLTILAALLLATAAPAARAAGEKDCLPPREWNAEFQVCQRVVKLPPPAGVPQPPANFVQRHDAILPPAEYSHAFPGEIDVRRVATEAEIGRLCPPSSYPRKLACPYHNPTECHIILVTDAIIYSAGFTPIQVIEHEIGHCNGWGADHKGARKP